MPSATENEWYVEYTHSIPHKILHTIMGLWTQQTSDISIKAIQIIC